MELDLPDDVENFHVMRLVRDKWFLHECRIIDLRFAPLLIERVELHRENCFGTYALKSFGDGLKGNLVGNNVC